MFAGLIGAITWNLATWYFGLPSSSSHALIGGVVGSAFVAEGPDAVLGAGIIEKVVVPALVAPVLALVVTAIAISLAYRIVGRRRPGPVTRGFRLGQIVSGSLFSLSHGTNDAQKTMGIIFLALIANGNLSASTTCRPGWWCRRPPRSRSAPTSAAGGSSGRWAAASSRWTRRRASPPRALGAAVILSASHVGFPLSTTQVISGAIMGAGAAKRLSAVRWGVAGNIAIAWVLTLPASAAVGAPHLRGRRALRRRRRGAARRRRLLLVALGVAFTRRAAAGRTLPAEG